MHGTYRNVNELNVTSLSFPLGWLGGKESVKQYS